jgi:hypothetical protein
MACGCGGNCCAPFPWAAPVKVAGRTMAAPVRTQGPCPPGTQGLRYSRRGGVVVKCVAARSTVGVTDLETYREPPTGKGTNPPKEGG